MHSVDIILLFTFLVTSLGLMEVKYMPRGYGVMYLFLFFINILMSFQNISPILSVISVVINISLFIYIVQFKIQLIIEERRSKTIKEV